MEIEKEEGEGEKDHHQKLFITIFEKGEEKINVGSSFFLLVASALGIHLKRERGGGEVQSVSTQPPLWFMAFWKGG